MKTFVLIKKWIYCCST